MPSDTDVEFGQIAVRHKLITRKQHDEAFKVLKKLEGQLRRQGKLKKKRPRLVDVLVQQDMITGSEAKSVENARKFRQIRLDDKLYARIALKSKFCSQDEIQDALDKQKKRYLGGKSPKRLFEFLVAKGTLSDEEHEAIEEAIAKLDAREYVARDKKPSGAGSDLDLDDDGSGSDLEELGSDLEEIDDDDLEEVEVEELSGSGIDLDLDDDEEVDSLDNDSEVDEIDSDIDVRLSGLEGDIDDLSGLDDVDDQDDTKSPPPRGLSSDLDLDDEDEDEDEDEIDLDDDEDDDDDDEDDDEDDDDDDDDSFGSDLDDIDLEDDDDLD